MAEADSRTPTAMTPPVLVAGKYRLSELLGRGGMGSVWAGVHTTLGTKVAVKFIDAEHVNSGEARQRFENEARAAAALRSKHVVEVYDHGVMEDGRPFIVMEFLHGEPLDRRLDRVGRLPPKDTSRIINQVCRALSKAHAAGIVHRDLKPENVFLVWDDEDAADVVKVVDFGIAKFTSAAAGHSSATRTGSVLGTPYYMSPEQARGLRGVDYRSDLWSVGVIAFRCMTGRLPFEGEAVGDVLVKLCTAPIPLASSLASDLPPGFDAWMNRALAREPEGRFQSAAELASSLSAVSGLSAPLAGAAESFAVHPPMLGRPSAVNSPFVATTPSGALTPMPGPEQTGAPITQTKPGHTQKPKASAVVAAAVAGLVVLGIGVGVVMKMSGQGGQAPPSVVSEPAAAAMAPAAQPPPVEEAKPVEAKPAVAPAATPQEPAPSASAPATSATAPVLAARPPRPAARPTPASKPKPKPGPAAAPPPRPESDMGF